jgi:site-specific recombinase XerD
MKRWDGLADGFMEVYSARGLAPGTIEAMRREWDQWGCWLKKKRPRPKVSHELITEYISQRGRFRSKATLYGMKSRMRQIGNFLVQRGIWRNNPLQWMKGPRLDRRHRLPRRIAHSSLQRIWESAASARYQFQRYLWVAVLGMAYGTGIRREELSLLDVSDWDAESGTLRITGKKTGQERRVPLPPLGRQCLEAYLPRRQNVLAANGVGDQPALLINGWGGRLSKAALSRGISGIARRAGVRVTLHQFRHTCASELLADGARLPHVQELLGHKSIGTTMRYLHLVDAELRRAMEKHPICELNKSLGNHRDSQRKETNREQE